MIFIKILIRLFKVLYNAKNQFENLSAGKNCYQAEASIYKIILVSEKLLN